MWMAVYSSVKTGKKIAGPIDAFHHAAQIRCPDDRQRRGVRPARRGPRRRVGYYSKELRAVIKNVTAVDRAPDDRDDGRHRRLHRMSIVLPIFKLSSLVSDPNSFIGTHSSIRHLPQAHFVNAYLVGQDGQAVSWATPDVTRRHSIRVSLRRAARNRPRRAKADRCTPAGRFMLIRGRPWPPSSSDVAVSPLLSVIGAAARTNGRQPRLTRGDLPAQEVPKLMTRCRPTSRRRGGLRAGPRREPPVSTTRTDFNNRSLQPADQRQQADLGCMDWADWPADDQACPTSMRTNLRAHCHHITPPAGPARRDMYGHRGRSTKEPG